MKNCKFLFNNLSNNLSKKISFLLHFFDVDIHIKIEYTYMIHSIHSLIYHQFYYLLLLKFLNTLFPPDLLFLLDISYIPGCSSCVEILTLTERVLGKYDLMTRKDSVNGRLPNRAPVIHMVGVI